MTTELQYTILEQEQGYLNVEIILPPERIFESRELVLERYKQTGRVPNLKVLENEILQHTMRQGVRQFVDAFPQVPWEEPSLTFISSDPETGLVFSTQMEILPEFDLPDYSTITIEMPPVALPSEELMLTELYDLSYSKAQETEVERPAQIGDRLLIDMVGMVGDAPIPTSARADYPLDLEENTLFPGFAEQLIGLSAGDSRDVRVILPADYSVVAWQNKEAIYSIYIHHVYEIKRPPLDDDFPLLIGKGSNTEEMSQQIYSELLQENQAMWVEAVREAIVNQVVTNTLLTIPDTLLDTEQISVWERTDKLALQKQGLTADFMDKAYDVWMAQEDIRLECYWNLKVALVLRAIAQKEQLQISEQELLETLSAAAEPYGSPVDEVYAEMQRTGTLVDFASKLLLSKTIDFLVTRTTLICDGQTTQLSE